MSPELGARACGGESLGWGARATVRDVLSCGISLCCRAAVLPCCRAAVLPCCRAAVLCVLSIVRAYIHMERYICQHIETANTPHAQRAREIARRSKNTPKTVLPRQSCENKIL